MRAVKQDFTKWAFATKEGIAFTSPRNVYTRRMRFVGEISAHHAAAGGVEGLRKLLVGDEVLDDLNVGQEAIADRPIATTADQIRQSIEF